MCSGSMKAVVGAAITSLLWACTVETTSAQTAKALGAEARIQDFYFFQRVNEFDDTDESFIATVSKEGVSVLTWRCMKDGLSVIFAFNEYYAGDSNGNIRVRYRFDKQPASDYEDWRLRQSEKSARIKNEASFTAAARAAGSVLMEARDPLGGSVRFRFSLMGLTAALPRLPCVNDS